MRCKPHGRVRCPDYMCQQAAKNTESVADSGTYSPPDPYASIVLGETPSYEVYDNTPSCSSDSSSTDSSSSDSSSSSCSE